MVLGRELLDAGVLAHGEAMDGEEEERGRVLGEGGNCVARIGGWTEEMGTLYEYSDVCRARTCADVCTYMHTHMHMYTYVHTCTHMHTHMYTHVHICTHICICTHMYTHVHTCTHICTHMYTYAHTYAYVHTCTHMHTHICVQSTVVPQGYIHM